MVNLVESLCGLVQFLVFASRWQHCQIVGPICQLPLLLEDPPNKERQSPVFYLPFPTHLFSPPSG